MPRYANNSDYIAHADQAWDRHEQREAMARFEVIEFPEQPKTVKPMSQPKSKLPECIACLSRIGWGIKRIVRHTGFAKTTVGRFMRTRGLTDEFISDAKRASVNAQKTAKAQKAKAERDSVQPFRVPSELRVPITREERNAKAMACYYANHDESKAANRENAKRQWAKTVIGSAQHMRRIVSSMIYKKTNGLPAYPVGRLVGCSWKSLHWHINTQLLEAMTWDTYATAWLIDCTTQANEFDLTSPSAQLVCFNWRNMRPRWKIASDGVEVRAPRRERQKVLGYTPQKESFTAPDASRVRKAAPLFHDRVKNFISVPIL